MAQSLTIAKAALAASLFRADPISVPRATVDALFPLLHSTVTQCSRLNVQKCKAWIIEHIAPSRGRTAALGKFLVAWSRSLEQGEGRTKPSLRRRRLHALYIVSDVLHHVVVKLRDDGFADALGEHAPALVACAAEFDNCPKHKRKLEDLLALWQDKRFFSDALMVKLRAALTGATIDTPTEAQPSTTSAKDVPYVLPSYHGDLSTPWYDLPAGTWLPHITPNSTKPMIPSLIKPVQLAPGPAGRSLVEAVSQLLTDVDGIFQKRSGNIAEAKTDVNMLGERVTIDEVTGEVIDGETYYGWSRAFCEKMKERKMKAKKGQGRGRSRSRSSDYSRGARDVGGDHKATARVLVIAVVLAADIHTVDEALVGPPHNPGPEGTLPSRSTNLRHLDNRPSTTPPSLSAKATSLLRLPHPRDTKVPGHRRPLLLLLLPIRHLEGNGLEAGVRQDLLRLLRPRPRLFSTNSSSMEASKAMIMSRPETTGGEVSSGRDTTAGEAAMVTEEAGEEAGIEPETKFM